MKYVSILILLVGCWTSAPPESPANVARPKPVAAADDGVPFVGNPTARVQIVSYFNYRCPHCKRFEPILEQLAQKYGDRIVIYYRTLKLSSHPEADLGAIAAFAAHRQGKFLAMHRELFKEGEIDRDAVISIAANLGLNMTRFKRDLGEFKLKDRVAEDTAVAEKAEIAYVPYLIINDQAWAGDFELAPLTAHIDGLLR